MYYYISYKFLHDKLIYSMDNSNRAVPHSNRANLYVKCFKWLRFVNITVINTWNYKGRIRINRCTCKTSYNHSGVREIDMHSTVGFLLGFFFWLFLFFGCFFFGGGCFFVIFFLQCSMWTHRIFFTRIIIVVVCLLKQKKKNQGYSSQRWLSVITCT